MIHLYDNIYLNSDSRCWIIEEHCTNKKGEEYTRQLTYHPTIAYALKSVCEKRLREAEASTLAELLAKQEVFSQQLLIACQAVMQHGVTH